LGITHGGTEKVAPPGQRYSTKNVQKSTSVAPMSGAPHVLELQAIAMVGSSLKRGSISTDNRLRFRRGGAGDCAQGRKMM
jgi:hypothetical protein